MTSNQGPPDAFFENTLPKLDMVMNVFNPWLQDVEIGMAL